jgi:dihydroneopterin aldolase
VDRIFLEGIHFDIRVGTTEEERSIPQPCRLDVVLRSSLHRAGETGNLQESIDYAAVFAAIERTCTTRTFQLLEEVAHQVCEEILAIFPVGSVRFQIRKLHPFSDKLNSVGIEIRRTRKKPTHNSAVGK